MTPTDAQVELIKIEQQERLLKDRLTKLMAHQFDLLNQEKELRDELTHLENNRCRILQICGGCSA